MPKSKNEVIVPNVAEREWARMPTDKELTADLQSPDTLYRLKMEEMGMKRNEQLSAKKKAVEYKLSVALEDKPPIDFSKEEKAIEYWEREKSRSLDGIEHSIAYQEEQLVRMRESYERSSKIVMERLELTKKSLSDKEAYFIEKTFQAQQRLELAKNPPESNRIRKLRAELKVIEEEMKSASNKTKKRLGLPVEEEDEDDDSATQTTEDTEGSDIYDEEKFGDMEYPPNSGITGHKAWFKFRMDRGLLINGQLM